MVWHGYLQTNRRWNCRYRPETTSGGAACPERGFREILSDIWAKAIFEKIAPKFGLAGARFGPGELSENLVFRFGARRRRARDRVTRDGLLDSLRRA